MLVQREVFAQFEPTFPLVVILGEEPKQPLQPSEAKLEDDQPINTGSLHSALF